MSFAGINQARVDGMGRDTGFFISGSDAFIGL